jgi:integrase
MHALPPVEGAVAAELLFQMLARWQRSLDVSGRANPRTRQAYRRVVVGFLADVIADPGWNGARDPLAFTEDDAIDWLARIPPQGSNRNLHLQALRSFYGFLAERDPPAIARNPFGRMRPKRVKYGPAPSLSPTELRAVLKAAADVDPRCAPALTLQLVTACRAGSLLALEPRDLIWRDREPWVVFREAKGSKPYAAMLSREGLAAFRELVRLIAWTPPKVRTRLPTLVGVRYSAYHRWVQRVEERAGVRVWSHLLRHTAISLWAEAGVDERTIMELANWDQSLLRRYASPSTPNIRRAVSVIDDELGRSW